MSSPSTPPMSDPEQGQTVVTVDFVRHRNALLMQADLGTLLVDYYLHQADHRLQPGPEQDTLLKQALVAFTLHAAARPRNEHLSWTIGLQAPRLNLFLSGDNEDCMVTGRLFTENVRESPGNVFYSELMPSRGAEKQRSVVNFIGSDLFRAAEAFYTDSEQRPARFFDLGDERFAMLLSHPDCDDAWLRRVTLPEVRSVAVNEILTGLTGDFTGGTVVASKAGSWRSWPLPPARIWTTCLARTRSSRCNAPAALPRTP